MEQWQKDELDRLTRIGYLPALSKWAENDCAPFWWYARVGPNGREQILNNGTVCYVNTGKAHLGITANHVYEKYCEALAAHGESLGCQFGGSTIRPEKHVIATSKKWDLATFDVHEVFVTASALTARSQHHAPKWPPDRIAHKQAVLYGGYPGVLREAKDRTADFPFQWFAWAVSDVGHETIVMEPAFSHLHWPGHEGEAINEDPGGMSGGPVFRVLDNELIARLELVGFIHEFAQEGGQAILARHADVISAEGHFLEN